MDELFFGGTSGDHYAVASLHFALALTCLCLVRGASRRSRAWLLPWLASYSAGLMAYVALEMYAGFARGDRRAFFKIAFVGENAKGF